jgi:outer membrane protein
MRARRFCRDLLPGGYSPFDISLFAPIWSGQTNLIGASGMMRKFVSTLAAVVALSAPAAQAETLADALIAAYRNSNLLDQNRAVLRAADEDVAIAVSSLRPVIAFVGQAGYAHQEFLNQVGGRGEERGLSSSISLTAEMTLVDFGRNELAIEVAKETVLATREALVGVEQNVLLAAVQAYVDVRLAQEIVGLRQSNLRLITQELRAARDRFEVGEITKTDVSIAEARLAASRASLASAEGDLMVARESYKAATGAYPGRLAGLPPTPKTARSLEDAQAVAERTHPSVRQAQREVTVAELNVARGKANMKPSLTAQARVSVDNDGLNTESLSLNLNQTLYAGGRLSALYRQSLAGRDSSRAALHQTSVLVAQNVGNTWSNLLVSAASIDASQRQITAAQEAFDGVREEATLGARTTLDVLDAEQELLDARAARLQAEAGRYTGVYALLSAMGLLTVDHLRLGIPTYDPAAYYNAVKSAPATSAQGRKLDKILEKIGN